MGISKRKDLSLKLGNLALAIWLATVPTFITYGTLSLHGLNICRTLNNKVELNSKKEIKALCNESAWETTKKYILLIGFFITLPTWFWFYMSMRNKIEKEAGKIN